MTFRKVLPALSFLQFLKFWSIKSSDMKILGHFNFQTKSLPKIFVLNVCVNLGKEHPIRSSKLDQMGLNCEHFVHLTHHAPELIIKNSSAIPRANIYYIETLYIL